MEQEETKRPLEVRLTNVGEVRMGSPYNLCNIELVGKHQIELAQTGWQDIYAWTEDSKRLVLIKWNFENNDPGFHLFLVNSENGKTLESSRILGLPESISITGDIVTYRKFLFDRTKLATDCFYVEKYNFEK